MRPLVGCLAFISPALAFSNASSPGRSLASEGCDNCCFKHDCSLAFQKSQPGVCCGAHPGAGGQTGCCPIGSQCVACGTVWKCSRSNYVSRSARCHICADNQPEICRVSYRRYSTHGSGDSLFFFLLLGICLCSIGGYFNRRQEPQVVYVQAGGGVVGQPVGPDGKPIPQQGAVQGVVQGGACKPPPPSPRRGSPRLPAVASPPHPRAPPDPRPVFRRCARPYDRLRPHLHPTVPHHV